MQLLCLILIQHIQYIRVGGKEKKGGGRMKDLSMIWKAATTKYD